MGRWVELAVTRHVDGQPVRSPSGRFVDLDRASYIAVERDTLKNGTPLESWVVRTDQGVLLDSTCGSEDAARSMVSALIETGGPAAETPSEKPTGRRSTGRRRDPEPAGDPAGGEAGD